MPDDYGNPTAEETQAQEITPEQEQQQIESERQTKEKARIDSLYADRRRLEKENARLMAQDKPADYEREGSGLSDAQKETLGIVRSEFERRDREQALRAQDKNISRDAEKMGIDRKDYEEAVVALVKELDTKTMVHGDPSAVYESIRAKYFNDNPAKAVRFYQGRPEASEKVKAGASAFGGGSGASESGEKKISEMSDSELQAILSSGR